VLESSCYLVSSWSSLRGILVEKWMKFCCRGELNYRKFRGVNYSIRRILQDKLSLRNSRPNSLKFTRLRRCRLSSAIYVTTLLRSSFHQPSSFQCQLILHGLIASLDIEMVASTHLDLSGETAAFVVLLEGQS
jgi:hypothetical protein